MRSIRIAVVAVVLAAVSTIGATSAQAADNSPAKASVKAAGWQW